MNNVLGARRGLKYYAAAAYISTLGSLLPGAPTWLISTLSNEDKMQIRNTIYLAAATARNNNYKRERAFSFAFANSLMIALFQFSQMCRLHLECHAREKIVS